MEQASQTSSSGPRVRMISQREIPEPAGLLQQGSASAPEQPSPPLSAAFLQQMMAVLSALALMLSARFLLLLAMAGASVLAALATLEPTTLKLAATVIYDVLVFIPLVWLYSKG